MVLLSSEDLSFRASVALLERVHAHLIQGTSAARALMLARAELAQSESWSHPFHHARLVAMGLPHATLPGLPPELIEAARTSSPGPVSQGGPPRLALFALILLILAAALLVVRALRQRRSSSRTSSR